jgi:hypothetical protein
MKMAAVWETVPSSLVQLIALMMEAVCTFETLVYFSEITGSCIPESLSSKK